MSDRMPADFAPHYGVALDNAGSMDFHRTLDEAAKAAASLVRGETLPIYKVTYERMN
jgi:hypothetical protein